MPPPSQGGAATLSEFGLIERYFVRTGGKAALGIGDDCALLTPRPGMQWAVSTDMLVEGRHFFREADPGMLGHKCLAVNLSDLAAMGAKPVAFTLALALPEADPEWLEEFSEGLFGMADAHGCELVGGDTTRGPLTVSITVFGEVAPGRALRRDAARAGDDIWVSGTLGDARLTLAALRAEFPLDFSSLAAIAHRMHTPAPQVALGLALSALPDTQESPRRTLAAIDVSDGVLGDLGHILARSRLGATVDVDALPVGPVLARQPAKLRREFALTGGDDYELCFCAPPEWREAVRAAAAGVGVGVTLVGTVEAEPGLRLRDREGAPYKPGSAAHDHFAAG